MCSEMWQKLKVHRCIVHPCLFNQLYSLVCSRSHAHVAVQGGNIWAKYPSRRPPWIHINSAPQSCGWVGGYMRCLGEWSLSQESPKSRWNCQDMWVFHLSSHGSWIHSVFRFHGGANSKEVSRGRSITGRWYLPCQSWDKSFFICYSCIGAWRCTVCGFSSIMISGLNLISDVVCRKPWGNERQAWHFFRTCR